MTTNEPQHDETPRRVVAWVELQRADNGEIFLLDIDAVDAVVKNSRVASLIKAPGGQSIGGGGDHPTELVLRNGMVLPITMEYFDAFHLVTGQPHPQSNSGGE